MYVGLIDESETKNFNSDSVLNSESKINVITLSIIGLFHLFAAVNEKFQKCFQKFSFIIWFRFNLNYQLLVSYQNVPETKN